MNTLTKRLSDKYNADKAGFTQSVLAIYHKYRYILNTNPQGVNILGIRSTEPDTNRFNDTCIYFAYNGLDTVLNICDFTTDPSSDNLRKPVNSKGCAILKEGQYKNMWSIGFHKSKKDHEALIQTGSCTVYRDNNKDENLDYNGVTESGYFGINCHRASAFKILEHIGLWSAGCQVFPNAKDLSNLIALCKNDIKRNNVKSFTYTLIGE